jgi:hypothetical protein
MSRSGYSEDGDYDNPSYLLWPSIVKRTINGKHSQAFLREMLGALDAMPEKRLIAEELQDGDGAVCAIGSVGAKRGVDMSKLDPEDPDGIAKAFDIAPTLVREIEFQNDDDFRYSREAETPEQRWTRVREWVVEQLAPPRRADYVSDAFYQKALAKWQAKQPDSASTEQT